MANGSLPTLEFATASDENHGMTSTVPAFEPEREECLLNFAFGRFDYSQ
jgi:hypothetical protein